MTVLRWAESYKNNIIINLIHKKKISNKPCKGLTEAAFIIERKEGLYIQKYYQGHKGARHQKMVKV